MPALSLENLLYFSAQVSLIAVAGAILSRFFRSCHARFHLAWCYLLLVTCIASPFVQKPLLLNAERAAEYQLAFMTTGAISDVVSLQDLVGWILLAGIATKLGFFFAGALRIRHYRKTAVPLHFPKESILSVCKLINRDVEIGVSAAEVGPVTFGWRRPMVLLPASFMSLNEPQQSAILCHELLHVIRRDWLMNVAEEMIGACLWFHPAFWWLLSQTKAAREEVVDAEVVRLTSARDCYLDALVAMAAGDADRSLATAPLFLRKRHLAKRLRRLLLDRPVSLSRVILSCTFVGCLMVATTAVAMTAFPLIARPRVDAPALALPQAAATPQIFTFGDELTAPKIISHIDPTYTDAARAERIQGMVVIETVVQPDGSVGALSVVRSLDANLDENALEAVKQWRFQPALRRGTPVQAKLFVEVNFQLRD